MKRKIVTMLLMMIIILIGKVDAATLTQKLGEAQINQTIKEGRLVKIQFKEVDNYTFEKWIVESGDITIDTTNPNINFIMPSSDVIIRAVYAEENAGVNLLALSYNANGGSGAPSAQTYTGTDASHTFTISSIVPTRSGWTFKGWSTSSTATSASYQPGGTIPISSDTTLYAVWEHTVTLTYNANGGSGAPSAQTYTGTDASHTFAISNTAPTRSGWTFKGWATSSTATSESYQVGGNIPVSSDTTLYAVWYHTLTLTYNANGGSGAPSAQTYTGTETSHTFTISSTVPTRSGWTFNGWSVSGTTYQPGGTIPISSNTTLTAVWEQTLELTLTYNANGGSGTPSAQTYTGTETNHEFTISSTVPTRSGWTFKGWATSSTATSASYQVGGNITISSSTTLYAVWEHTLKLTYYANGGSGAPSAQTYTGTAASHTFTISSTVPTLNGWTFEGWSTSGTTYQPNESITISSNTTLSAVWSKTITLTFDDTEGTGAPSAETHTINYPTTYYSFVIPAQIPTRSGYTFSGWAKESDAESADYQPGAEITIVNSTTLYAVWNTTASPAIASGSWYRGSTACDTITQIDVVNSYTLTGNETENWNADVDNSGSVKCYVEGTKLTVVGNGTGTIQVTDALFMFSNWSELVSINGFDMLDFSSVSSLEGMFTGCSSLTSIDASRLPRLDLYMFSNCSSLTSLNLSHITVGEYCAFSGMDSLQEITLGPGFEFWCDSSMDESYYVLPTPASGKWYTEDGTGYTPSELIEVSRNTTTATTYYAVNPVAPILSKTWKDNIAQADLEALPQLKIVDSYSNPNGYTSYNVDEAGTGTIKLYVSDGYTEAIIAGNGTGRIKLPSDSSNMFCFGYSGSNLQKIEGLELLDTSEVTNMANMFYYQTSLTELDLSSWDTSNVTNMGSMIQYCFPTKLDISSFDTTNLEGYQTFDDSGASELTLGPKTFAGVNSGNLLSFFSGPWYKADGTELTKEEMIAETRTGPVTYYTTDPRTITLSKTWKDNIAQADLEALPQLKIVDSYSNPNGYTSYNVDEAGTGTIKLYVSDGYSEAIIVGNGTGRIKLPSDSSEMFCFSYSGANLQKIEGLELLDTSEVTNMGSMFYYQTSLTELDLSSWDTSNVTNMSGMFMYCWPTKLDISSFDTTKLEGYQSFDDSGASELTLGPKTFAGANSGNLLVAFASTWYKADGTELTKEEMIAETRTGPVTYYTTKPSNDISIVNVGDYITYVPSSTSYTVPTTASGYTSDQNFNPSIATSWRVFSNSEGNVEIISTDSVGSLYLRGSTGYVNAVQTLNDMSVAYVNNTYATSGRSLGYYDKAYYIYETNSGNAMTETQKSNYRVIDTSSYPLNYGVSGFPYTDYQYLFDKTVLANHGSMYHSSGTVWLASHVMSGSENLLVRGINASGVESYAAFFFHVYSDGSMKEYSYSSGVRPIISLKSGLTITGGSGTEADPYVINTTNPSQYTITYNANGGYGEMMPQSVSQGSSVTLTPNTYEHHSKIFAGWSTSATATTATYADGATITPIADMTLYAVWEETIASKVSVGDYITYVPSNTSYTVPASASGYYTGQNYNPSTTTSWRVLSIDGTNVEIVSADSVGTLYLEGEKGYTNAVQTLNDMSGAYVNSTYAESGRSLGYYDKTRYTSDTNSGSAMTESELVDYQAMDTNIYPLVYGFSGFPYADYQYIPDKTALDNHGSMYHNGYVWLASRDIYTGLDYNTYLDYNNYLVKSMTTNGNIYNNLLYCAYSDGNYNESECFNGVRPVVLLKSGLTITGGSGTSTNPYVISVP